MSREREKQERALLLTKERSTNSSATRDRSALRQEQDEVLDEMKDSIGRLTLLSQGIGEELQSQVVELTDLNEDTEITNEQMEVVLKKTDKLVEKSGYGLKKIVLCLAITAAILVLLILFI
eukprot:TRINITY_DN10757_c0_g1_i1.p1 TRINITY_DN10757_c0_g1~~TRINITY_DN10757_c0_g1_i1.p1  ORF type:complete len:121 (+),score=25.24 TRINITY_DN10757_c0_g1_i1:103-465(+)